MAVVHYLNVNQGDCSVIQHASGHVSVIDVCNAKKPADRGRESRLQKLLESGVLGNFNQKKHPVKVRIWGRGKTDRRLGSVLQAPRQVLRPGGCKRRKQAGGNGREEGAGDDLRVRQGPLQVRDRLQAAN
jgi:hypothetical protein